MHSLRSVIDKAKRKLSRSDKDKGANSDQGLKDDRRKDVAE
jgi:hypothetical protein